MPLNFPAVMIFGQTGGNFSGKTNVSMTKKASNRFEWMILVRGKFFVAR
jgi:hypothetical protein